MSGMALKFNVYDKDFSLKDPGGPWSVRGRRGDGGNLDEIQGLFLSGS